eukprot:751054-Hanusia_phi.AAC.8
MEGKELWALTPHPCPPPPPPSDLSLSSTSPSFQRFSVRKPEIPFLLLSRLHLTLPTSNLESPSNSVLN